MERWLVGRMGLHTGCRGCEICICFALQDGELLYGCHLHCSCNTASTVLLAIPIGTFSSLSPSILMHTPS